MLLEGRCAIVTGGSSGIGKSTALRLAEEGADVCVNYYSEKEQGDADAVVKEIEGHGRRGIAVQADVGNEDDVVRMVSRTCDALHDVDRVVNIAPGAIATPINNFVLDDPEAKHAVEEEIPLGHFGQPEDIASAVVWVASEQASYVTGTTLVVDGGMSLYPKFV